MQPSSAIVFDPLCLLGLYPYQARKAGGGTNTLRQDNQAVHPTCTCGDCCSVSASTLNAFTSN